MLRLHVALPVPALGMGLLLSSNQTTEPSGANESSLSMFPVGGEAYAPAGSVSTTTMVQGTRLPEVPVSRLSLWSVSPLWVAAQFAWGPACTFGGQRCPMFVKLPAVGMCAALG